MDNLYFHVSTNGKMRVCNLLIFKELISLVNLLGENRFFYGLSQMQRKEQWLVRR